MSTKFVVNDIKILSSWGFNLPSNTDCTICRCNLNTNSLYHQDKAIDSFVVEGGCGHSFHYECIKPWVDKNNHCPICSAQWVYKNKPETKIQKNTK
jgi:RING-box protein 1